MLLGICTSLDRAAVAHAAGFDFIEITAGSLVPADDESAFTPIRTQALASPIPVRVSNCFIPGHLKVVGPSVDIDALRAYMEIALCRAAEIGVKTMVFGSGGARMAPKGFPISQATGQFTSAVCIAADVAAQYGMTIVLEPLAVRECNVVNTLDEGGRIIRSLNHPQAKLLADSYHMFENNESFGSVITHSNLLSHIHIDMPDVHAITTGTPSYFPEFIGNLIESGYEGYISIENHSFKPNEGSEITEYYAAAYEYLASLLSLKRHTVCE